MCTYSCYNTRIKCQQSQTFSYIWWQYWSQCSHIDLCHLRNWPRVVTFHWMSHKSYKRISECTEKKMQRGGWLETRSCVWKECSALGLQTHQPLSDTSSGNGVIWASNVPLYSEGKLKKIPSLQRLGLALKIVLLPLLQVMSTIAVARIPIFLTASVLWVAEQFLCIALSYHTLGSVSYSAILSFFQYLFYAMGNQHKYCGSEKTMG